MENNEFKNINQAQDYLQEKYETTNAPFDLSEHGVVHDSVSVVEVGESIVVSCLKHDEAPMDYFENDDGAGEFFQFRSVDSRDDKVSELKKDKKLFYLVDKYEHGIVHFSISGTQSYPDQRWDVAQGCAIFVPCDYIQQEYKKLAKKTNKEEAKLHFVADSNSVLDNYSDWCNGEVYGYSVTVFNTKGEELENDECWGFIGYQYAEAEKKSVAEHYINKAKIVLELAQDPEVKQSKPKM